MSNDRDLGPELHPDWLRVPLGPGHGHADFHYRWLRHNCDRERHPATGERTLCSSELPGDLSPRTAVLTADALEIEWAPDGHRSRYPLGWLRAHAYAVDRVAVPPPPAELARILVEGHGPLPQRAAQALARVQSRGAAVVRRDPADITAPEDATEFLISAFEAIGLRVVGTHFGRIEDLRTDNTTNHNTDQLGYTDAPIGLHTDQPFLERPPRYQLLQGIRSADDGGVNLLADARAAFEYLEAEDAHAAELLRGVPLTFHRKQQQFERTVVAPLISGSGDEFQIRCSYFTLAPHALPFARMLDYYSAHDRFIRLVRDPRHHYRVLLAPGDWLLYDNHRTLHARTGFTGARWLRGVYFDPSA
jgi:gamma-butyrobetaine dioxygenase